MVVCANTKLSYITLGLESVDKTRRENVNNVIGSF